MYKELLWELCYSVWIILFCSLLVLCTVKIQVSIAKVLPYINFSPLKKKLEGLARVNIVMKVWVPYSWGEFIDQLSHCHQLNKYTCMQILLGFHNDDPPPSKFSF
jgi:hypothetical protein